MPGSRLSLVPGLAHVWLGLAGGLLAAAAVGQQTLEVYAGQAPQERFGRSADFLGDLDGDGLPEVLVGTDVDRVDIISGGRGLVLRSHSGASGQSYGRSVAALGDVDFDGVEDYAIGAPELGAVGPGFVEIRSGATGGLMHTLVGAQIQDKFGAVITRVFDLDFDGADDLMVGSPSAQTGGSEVGRAEVFSSITGQRLWLINGVASNDNFGSALADVGDIDGDLIGDFAIGAPGGNQPPLGFLSGTGTVTVFSGFTGATLHHFVGDAADDFFGQSIVGVGDLDGDGFDDLAVGAPGVDLPGMPNAGRLRFLSGLTGATIFDRDGASAQQRFAEFLAPAGDRDGDGIAEIQVGMPNDATLVPGGGAVEVFCPTTGLLAERHEGDVVFGQLGTSLVPARDWDGDGRAELALITPGAPAPTLASGEVVLVSTRPFLGPAATGSFSMGNGDREPLLLVNGAPGEVVGHRVELAAGQSFNLEVRAPAGSLTPRPFALFGASVTPHLSDGVEDSSVGAMAFIPCPLLPGAQPLLFTVADGLFGGGCPGVTNPGFTPWLRTVSGLPAGLVVALQGVMEREDGSLGTTNGVLLIVD